MIMNKRPNKKNYSEESVAILRDKAIDKTKEMFLPNDKIIKIYLIGSSVKGDFGEYEPPGYRSSLFSDFDFIFFVEDDYIIPDLDKEPDGRPFPDDSLNLTYRIRKFVDDKYDAEVFFIRKSTMENKQIQKFAEAPGCEIPFAENSNWQHIVVYRR